MGQSCLGQIGPKSNRNEGILHMGQRCLGQIGPKSNRNEGILHMDQSFFGVRLNLRVIEMKEYSTWVRVVWVKLDLRVIEMKEYSTWIRVFFDQIEPKSDRNEGILHMDQSFFG